jgi:hypothetical protein
MTVDKQAAEIKLSEVVTVTELELKMPVKSCVYEPLADYRLLVLQPERFHVPNQRQRRKRERQRK